MEGLERSVYDKLLQLLQNLAYLSRELCTFADMKRNESGRQRGFLLQQHKSVKHLFDYTAPFYWLDACEMKKVCNAHIVEQYERAISMYSPLDPSIIFLVVSVTCPCDSSKNLQRFLFIDYSMCDYLEKRSTKKIPTFHYLCDRTRLEYKACSYCCEKSARKRCARCWKVRYCNIKCQKKHWPFHKDMCVPIVFEKGKNILYIVDEDE